MLEPIEKYIKKFGQDREIGVFKIEICYEYALEKYFDVELPNVKLIEKLWQSVKEFININGIKTENEYNHCVDGEYIYCNILHEILNFYNIHENKYANERIEIFNEAQNIVEIGNYSKEIIVKRLTEAYCDLSEKDKAIKLVDKYIMDNPTSVEAILIKSNIYSRGENPDYKEAIDVIERTLKKNDLINKIILLEKLAILYEDIGNDEKANEYQKLFMQQCENGGE